MFHAVKSVKYDNFSIFLLCVVWCVAQNTLSQLTHSHKILSSENAHTINI